MPRIRTIKPDFFSHESVMRLSRDSRLFFLGLLTYVDDRGRGRYLPRKIIGELFPFDDDVTPVEIDNWLTELEIEQMVLRYRAEGNNYLFIVNFLKHQRVEHPSKSYLPEPPEFDENSFPVWTPNSRDPHESLTTPSRGPHETLMMGNRKQEIVNRKQEIVGRGDRGEPLPPKKIPEKSSESPRPTKAEIEPGPLPFEPEFEDSLAKNCYLAICQVPRFKADFDRLFEPNRLRLEKKIATWRGWIPPALEPDTVILEQVEGCVEFFRSKNGRLANLATLANWMDKAGERWRLEKRRSGGVKKSEIESYQEAGAWATNEFEKMGIDTTIRS